MQRLDVMAKVYELVDEALGADDEAAAAREALADLRVLGREDLERVAMAILVELTWVLLPPVDRLQLRDRVVLRRAALPWAEERS